MKATIGQIAQDYRSGLDAYLAVGGEPELGKAYELGRAALNDEIGLLDLVAIHHEALAALLVESRTTAEAARRLSAGRDFVSEAISPFEMTHRGFREANTALHRINERLETEVKRIAHVIHDDTGALLVTVHLAFKELERDLSPSGHEQLASVRARLSELEEHLRQLSHELRPTILDELGLVPALRFLAQGVSVRSGLKVDVVDRVHSWFPPPVQMTLYRIVQEAFANIVRHARATRASVELTRGGKVIRCSIRDDGVGMNSTSKAEGRHAGHGLGLLGIRERLDAIGGTLRIDSASGQGTELIISIPLEA